MRNLRLTKQFMDEVRERVAADEELRRTDPEEYRRRRQAAEPIRQALAQLKRDRGTPG